MLEENGEMFTKPFTAIYYFYNEWQSIFDLMEAELGVTFEQGPPNADSFNKMEPGSCCIIDDQMSQMCNSKELVEIFTVKSHHKDLSVVFTSEC